MRQFKISGDQRLTANVATRKRKPTAGRLDIRYICQIGPDGIQMPLYRYEATILEMVNAVSMLSSQHTVAVL